MSERLSAEDKIRQACDYIKKAELPADTHFDTRSNPDYFIIGSQKIFYKGDARGAAVQVNDTASRGDVAIPEGAARLNVSYTSPRKKNILVDLSPHGSRGRDEQAIIVEGNANNITFTAGSPRGRAVVSGNNNVIRATEANDQIEIASRTARNNRILGNGGADTIQDQRLRFFGYGIVDNPQTNFISGGPGTDAYQILIYRGYRNGDFSTISSKFPKLNVTFDGRGTATVSDNEGHRLAQVMSDVERLEVKLEKGDLYRNSFDDVYRMDFAALRREFDRLNVRLECQCDASEPVKPVTVDISFNGANAGPRVPVTKIAGHR